MIDLQVADQRSIIELAQQAMHSIEINHKTASDVNSCMNSTTATAKSKFKKKQVRQIPGERDPRYHKLTFGKYRGYFLKDVPSDYLEWVCRTFEDAGRVHFFQTELKKRAKIKAT